MAPSTSTGGKRPGTAEAAMSASTVTVALSNTRFSRRTRSVAVTSRRTGEVRICSKSREDWISSRSGAGSKSAFVSLRTSRVNQPGRKPAKKRGRRSEYTCSRVTLRQSASSRSARPLAISAALSAPAEDTATRRMGSPRSTKVAATPASYAPLAPPPESTRAMGASRPTSDDEQAALAKTGVIRDARRASAVARHGRLQREGNGTRLGRPRAAPSRRRASPPRPWNAAPGPERAERDSRSTRAKAPDLRAGPAWRQSIAPGRFVALGNDDPTLAPLFGARRRVSPAIRWHGRCYSPYAHRRASRRHPGIGRGTRALHHATSSAR